MASAGCDTNGNGWMNWYLPGPVPGVYVPGLLMLSLVRLAMMAAADAAPSASPRVLASPSGMPVSDVASAASNLAS